MFNLRLPSTSLALIVSAPALLAGELVAKGAYAQAGAVALVEMFVILIAGAIASQRQLD